jgi:hypothetical protein
MDTSRPRDTFVVEGRKTVATVPAGPMSGESPFRIEEEK